ncbi:MAG: leucine-rich repeat domain-containing protein [SAR324 cluster bacterium]|nr:leucine-rich repeat domain-containing protein [SAR324 cluster bacterium]
MASKSSKGKQSTQCKLTAILSADVAGLSRWLNRPAFCLLLLALLALWGCEDGTTGPDTGITSPPESVSTEIVIPPADGGSTAGSVSTVSIFSIAGGADPASEAAGPEAPSRARGGFESTAIDTPGHGKFLESRGLDACIMATGAASGLITELSCTSQGIESLDGIEGLHALTRLELNDNNISDLSPLVRLKNLQSLKLAANRVKDIGPLAALAELTDLILVGNRIDDVEPLTELNRLVVLELTSNQISDVDDLAVMEGLRYLNLDDNEIIDVSALRHLTSLRFLHLSSNRITLGVTYLDALTEARSIVMMDNNNIACSDLDALEDALAADVLLRPLACVPF